MVDAEKQAAFVSGLRKLAEDAASKNPALAEMRAVAKATVDEMRNMLKEGESTAPLGMGLVTEGGTVKVRGSCQEVKEALAEIFLDLKKRASDGTLVAAAVCHFVEQRTTDGTTVTMINVHMEHTTGKAFRGLVPSDVSTLQNGVPGVDGPAVLLSGGPVQPKIFPVTADPNARFSK